MARRKLDNRGVALLEIILCSALVATLTLMFVSRVNKIPETLIGMINSENNIGSDTIELTSYDLERFKAKEEKLNLYKTNLPLEEGDKNEQVYITSSRLEVREGSDIVKVWFKYKGCVRELQVFNDEVECLGDDVYRLNRTYKDIRKDIKI